MSKNTIEQPPSMEALFDVGAHFGVSRSRRHPSVKPFIFGTKDKVEIFDLEKTLIALSAAENLASEIGAKGGTIVFVGGKNEAREAVKTVAQSAGLPFVAGRFIGGSLTNFPEIRKRINRMEDLTSQKEKGELAKYTKKERLLIDKEIAKLQEKFSGISSLKSLPQAMFVVDPRREHIAVAEANRMKIPVIALASSDCNLSSIEAPIPANDATIKSIRFFTERIASAFQQGKKLAADKKPAAAQVEESPAGKE